MRERDLLPRGGRVVTAVSGGADSVFLVLALHALAPVLDLSLHVAHLHHGWRGQAAAEDAAFVQALAGRLGLPFHGAEVDAPAFARQEGLAPEDAARRLRYAFLLDVCRTTGAGTLATGHTQDDQVETVLLALLRGSGPAGLAGMPWSGPLPVPVEPPGSPLAASPPSAPGSSPEGTLDVRLVRPLLALTRAAVRGALHAWAQPWREDASNADLSLRRNRVRLELLPLLESITPGYRQAVLRAGDLAAEAQAVLVERTAEVAATLFTRDAAGRLAASRAALLQTPPALRRALVRWAVREVQGDTRDLEAAHVAGALRTLERGRGGAVSWLSPRVRLRLAGGAATFEPAPSPPGRPGGGSAPREAPSLR